MEASEIYHCGIMFLSDDVVFFYNIISEPLKNRDNKIFLLQQLSCEKLGPVCVTMI